MTIDVPATPPIPFGEWMPDMGDFSAGGALLVKNCIPYGDKYKPFFDISEISVALPTGCKGAYAYRDAAGVVTIFAGTKTKLYMLDGTTWSDVTRLSGDYTLGDDNFWCFTNFGTLVIATNYTNDIQVFDVASDTEFSQLSATAPRARWVAVVNNFLVAVDTVDGDGAVGFRVRWSPIGNPAGTWGSDPDTQTDFQDIYDSKYSNTFVAQVGDYGVVVQGRSIWRMDYVGGDFIFDFKQMEEGRGSILSRSCVYNGKSIFMRSEDGFYEFNNGQMLPIGDKRIDDYFATNFDESFDYNLCGTVDPIKKLVIWAVPHIDSTGGVCNKLYTFSWVDRKWSIIDQETDYIFSFLTTGYTLEDLDDISASLDALPFSLDSRAWTGGKNMLAAFTTDHTLGLFIGDKKTATIQTGEVRPNAGGAADLSSVIPYIEGGSFRGRLAVRNRISDTPDWTTYVDQNPYTGELDFNANGVFFRLEIEISGDWSTAHSVGLKLQNAGVV
jgi:hypothetical protein